MGITRFAQNDLVRLSYEIDGPDTVAVVILLHATLTDRAVFGPLRETLSERYRVILPDARGHGGSSALKDRTFSVTDMANDLHTVMEAERLLGDNADHTEVHLVGYGQGAIAALELAKVRPDLITSLALLEPDALAILDGDDDQAVIDAREDARTAHRDASDAAYKGLADQALTRYLDRRWGGGWQDRLSRPRQAAVRRNLLALSASLDALDRYRLGWDDLQDMVVPARVLAGATSPLAERRIATRLGQWLPNGRSVFVPELPGGDPFRGAGEAAINVVESWIDEFAAPA